LERCKTLAEGAGAVAVAALLQRDITVKGEKVVVVISGGNVDTTLLSKFITQGLIESGRYSELKVLVEDKPGGLAALLRIISTHEANILDINFDRYSVDIPFNYIIVNLALETKNSDHALSLTHEIQKQFQVY